MSVDRIKEIDKLILDLKSEKEHLEYINKLPELEKKVHDYLNNKSGGQMLLSKGYSLSEFGLWQVKGEDPNCDLGGSHINPDLGIFEGTLKDALIYAVSHKGFYQWGAGGYVTKVDTIKINK